MDFYPSIRHLQLLFIPQYKALRVTVITIGIAQSQACIINSTFDLNQRHQTSHELNLDLQNQKWLYLSLSYTPFYLDCFKSFNSNGELMLLLFLRIVVQRDLCLHWHLLVLQIPATCSKKYFCFYLLLFLFVVYFEHQMDAWAHQSPVACLLYDVTLPHEYDVIGPIYSGYVPFHTVVFFVLNS